MWASYIKKCNNEDGTLQFCSQNNSGPGPISFNNNIPGRSWLITFNEKSILNCFLPSWRRSECTRIYRTFAMKITWNSFVILGYRYVNKAKPNRTQFRGDRELQEKAFEQKGRQWTHHRYSLTVNYWSDRIESLLNLAFFPLLGNLSQLRSCSRLHSWWVWK